jgi:DNA-binding transcriptional MerR regulator
VATSSNSRDELPSIPAKRYFTIGEVSELCGVKPHVLRYWEQEFTQLRPVKRRGNRRYYQHHEVLLVRRIRELLYEEGFTISGARNRLTDGPVKLPARPCRGTGAGTDGPLPAPSLPNSRNIESLRRCLMPFSAGRTRNHAARLHR